MMHNPQLMLMTLVLLLVGCATSAHVDAPAEKLVGKIVQLNDNSAYSWFSEPRAIIWNDKLIVGSVRAVEMYKTGQSDPNWGNIEVAALDLKTGEAQRTVLDRHFEQDDHDDPAFLPLPGNRLLA